MATTSGCPDHPGQPPVSLGIMKPFEEAMDPVCLLSVQSLGTLHGSRVDTTHTLPVTAGCRNH